VIGASGSLTGYAGGLEAKRRLLAHEARVVGGAPPDLIAARIRDRLDQGRSDAMLASDSPRLPLFQ
jgi:hypothetical protein